MDLSSDTIINLALILINVIGFILMGEDKRRARKGSYRISEQTLWIFATIGGAIAMTLAMRYFHHKTKHMTFKLGFPILAIIQILLYFQFFVR
jgi:uncharacterized membrane protein YsdA (DUF1294 family)